VVGKSVGELAKARNEHPADVFLNLLVAHGPRLRWRTLIAHHRPQILEKRVCGPSTLIGFADSGAHIRNMAFYNFGVRLLKLVRDAELIGHPVMPIETAIWRLTGERGEWFDIDAGRLFEGARADGVILDPHALDDCLASYQEAPMEAFGGLQRMVNRGAAVDAVLITGRIAYQQGEFASGLGHARG
jgi:N-acyl-D-aspartate/D-glutamate deacylase